MSSSKSSMSEWEISPLCAPKFAPLGFSQWNKKWHTVSFVVVKCSLQFRLYSALAAAPFLATWRLCWETPGLSLTQEIETLDHVASSLVGLFYGYWYCLWGSGEYSCEEPFLVCNDLCILLYPHPSHDEISRLSRHSLVWQVFFEHLPSTRHWVCNLE